MLDKLPEKHFVDKLNYLFPNTTSQFKSSLVGKKKYYYLTKENEQRDYCIRKFFTKLLFSPVVIPSLAGYNCFQAFWRIRSLCVTTAKLPFNFSEHKDHWIKTAKRIIDFSLAAILSPAQPFAHVTRLGVGIIAPSTYFMQEARLLNDRLDDCSLQDKLPNRLDFKGMEHPSEELSNKVFMETLYVYTRRWGLTRSKQVSRFDLFGKRSKGFFVTRKQLAKHNDEKVEDKYRLLISFQKLFKDQENFTNSDDLVKFVRENFTTPRQKTLLKMFLKKSPVGIISNSESHWDFSPNCRKEMIKQADILLEKLRKKDESDVK